MRRSWSLATLVAGVALLAAAASTKADYYKTQAEADGAKASCAVKVNQYKTEQPKVAAYWQTVEDIRIAKWSLLSEQHKTDTWNYRQWASGKIAEAATKFNDSFNMHVEAGTWYNAGNYTQAYYCFVNAEGHCTTALLTLAEAGAYLNSEKAILDGYLPPPPPDEEEGEEEGDPPPA
jgi:hypothetical protein